MSTATEKSLGPGSTRGTRRVVHLTSVHPPDDIRIFQKECAALADAGYDVTLIAPADAEARCGRVRVKMIPKPRGRLERMTVTTARLLWAAIRSRAELVHVHDPELLPCLNVLRALGKRVVFDMHEDTPMSLSTREWISTVIRSPVARLYKLLERVLLTGIPVVFAADSLAAAYPWVSEGTMVRNYPILRQLLQLSEPLYPTPTITYVGAVTRQRGSVRVLDAVAECWRQGVHVDLEYVGMISEVHRQELLGRVPRLKSGEVRILGYLEPIRAWQHAARAHIGIAVLEPLPNYVGSLATKLLEYMALGKPVICSNMPLYTKLVEGAVCGICVDPTDTGAIANAIRHMLSHPAEAALLGTRGREVVKNGYDWELESRKLIALYDRLLQ